MNIRELEENLNALGIPNDMYSIMEGGLPNEKLCIVQEKNWQVYYSERGCKTGLTVFDTEEEACEYFYNELKPYASI